MKFNQLIKYNMKNTFLQNCAENEGGKLVPDFFQLFKKSLYKVKANGQHLGFNMIWQT